MHIRIYRYIYTYIYESIRIYMYPTGQNRVSIVKCVHWGTVEDSGTPWKIQEDSGTFREQREAPRKSPNPPGPHS